MSVSRLTIIFFALAAAGCQRHTLGSAASSTEDAAAPGEAAARDLGAHHGFDLLAAETMVRGDAAWGASCADDGECGTGLKCLVEAACAKRCITNQCSAAPPFNVCGCDGMVKYYPHGCGGAYAWALNGYTRFDAKTGERCNPEGYQPEKWTLTIEGRDFHAFSGRRVVLVANGRRWTSAIVDGAFREVLVGAGSGSLQDGFFIDLNDDGECQMGMDLVGHQPGHVQADMLALTRSQVLTPAQGSVRHVFDCPR